VANWVFQDHTGGILPADEATHRFCSRTRSEYCTDPPYVAGQVIVVDLMQQGDAQWYARTVTDGSRTHSTTMTQERSTDDGM
jgi:hypothetical protein